MNEQDSPASSASRRPTPPHPVARKVAGGRRNTNVVGANDSVPPWLRTSAGWSWRLLVVIFAIALVFYATSRVQLVFIAVFIALVLTAVMRPLTEVFARVMPRALATTLSLLCALLVLGGMLTYVGASVAGQWNTLADKFNDGIGEIFETVEKSPIPISITADDVAQLIEQGRTWLVEHSGDVASTAFAQVGSLVEIFTVLALATFLTVFFLARGAAMWTWFLNQLPMRAREGWATAGGAGWYTFSGYARGTVIIAFADGILAAILLTVCGVPLAGPLAVLVFIGAFIPLIGAPAAMVIAMVVALAANGIGTMIVVGIGIALIGQLEGHILQPLVMGKQVSLHPVVIALVVTGGTLVAGILGAVISVPLVAVGWSVFSKMRTLDPPLDEDEAVDAVEPVDEDADTSPS